MCVMTGYAIIVLRPFNKRVWFNRITQMTLFFIAWAVCGAFHLSSGRFGALAQLGARNTGSVEVTGSNPVCSIFLTLQLFMGWV